jgi:hypothetical protein
VKSEASLKSAAVLKAWVLLTVAHFNKLLPNKQVLQLDVMKY